MEEFQLPSLSPEALSQEIEDPDEDFNGLSLDLAVQIIEREQPFPFTFKIYGDDGETVIDEPTIKLLYPNLGIQQRIDALTAAYSNGLEPNQLSNAAFRRARGRATLEMLGQAPFPQWLPISKDMVTVEGKKKYLPDTSKMRRGDIIIAFDAEFQRFRGKIEPLLP